MISLKLVKNKVFTKFVNFAGYCILCIVGDDNDFELLDSIIFRTKDRIFFYRGDFGD